MLTPNRHGAPRHERQNHQAPASRSARRHRRPADPAPAAQPAPRTARPFPVPQPPRPADLSGRQSRPAVRAASAPRLRDRHLHPRRHADPPGQRRPRKHHPRRRRAVDDGRPRHRARRALAARIPARRRPARTAAAMGQPAGPAEDERAGLYRPAARANPGAGRRRRRRPAPDRRTMGRRHRPARLAHRRIHEHTRDARRQQRAPARTASAHGVPVCGARQRDHRRLHHGG